ncbi:hypothetical protein L914_08558 [Phytophthora nicotianae]|uniref:Uncharacterized protein n=1 Tax=Phytophthora nicotianae TaxID=4792 RepID=W2ND50_PHYNI|nr:hypothetical protein L914_08558 [Phytophthora nicotianae]
MLWFVYIGRWLRERKPVDYVQAVHGFTRDPSSDEDYVDDPVATTDDVANENTDMESLEGEENDEGIADATVPVENNDAAPGEKDVNMAENDVDVDAKNAPAAVADPRSGDAAMGTRDDIGTTTAATSTSGGEDSTQISILSYLYKCLSSFEVTEQCVDAGKKDTGTSAATTVKDDAPVSVADDGNDIADPETRDSNVDEGDANVEDGDAVVDWTVDEADANVDEGDVDAEVDANVNEGHDEKCAG